MEIEEDLVRFFGQSEPAARLAFDRLSSAARPWLIRHLARNGVPAHGDGPDIAQDALLRVWLARSTLKPASAVQWRALLRVTATRLAIDRYRSASREPPPPLEPAPEEDDLLDSVRLNSQLRRLYHCANVVWLSLDPAVQPREYQRRLLAVQRVALDREPVARVAASLPCCGSPPITGADIEAWMADPAVWRLLSFESLYFPADRLLKELLPAPLRSLLAAGHLEGEALRHGPDEEAAPGWTWSQAAVLAWRYQRRLSSAEMLRRAVNAASAGGAARPWRPENIDAALVSISARLPFIEVEKQILGSLQRCGGAAAATAMASRPVWQRLVFQYAYHDDLPQEQILERVEGACSAAGFHLTPGMVNVWVSGGRLRQELAARWRELFAGDFHD